MSSCEENSDDSPPSSTRPSRAWPRLTSSTEEDSDSSGAVTFRSESEQSDVSTKRERKRIKSVKKFSVVLKTTQRRPISAVSVEASSIKMFIEKVKDKFAEKCPGDTIDCLLLEIGKDDEIELEENLIDFEFLNPGDKHTVLVKSCSHMKLKKESSTDHHHSGPSNIKENRMIRLDSCDSANNGDLISEVLKKGAYQLYRTINLDLVARCARPLVKRVMSRCYGTQSTCNKLREMLERRKLLKRKCQSSELQKVGRQIEQFSKENMCLRISELNNFIFEDYWLTECRNLLTQFCPSKRKILVGGKRKNKWEVLDEDMGNWEPSACLSVIIHAKDMRGRNIFKSPLVNFPGDENKYDFVSVAEKVKEGIRHNDCHSATTSDITNTYDEGIYLVLDFLSSLQKWYDRNELKAAYKNAHEAFVEIKSSYDGLLQKSVPQWNLIYENLKEIDPDSTCYMLITAPLHFNGLSESQKKGLSSVPWCCVVDYDPYSSKEGFLSFFQICKSQTIACESKTYLDMQKIECTRQYGDSAEKLASGHKCFWFLPHGDVENETHKYCPLQDENTYNQRVRHPLNKVLTFILERVKSEKPVVVVFLCYDEYAIDGQHFPSFFHTNLIYLYQSVVGIIGQQNVMFFTDRRTSLGSISCFHIPLKVLCDQFYQECSDDQDSLPIVLPSSTGDIRIETGEVNVDISIPLMAQVFEVIHKKIDETELDDLEKAKIKDLGGVKISKRQLDEKIIEDITTDFLKGNQISWIGLSHHIDINRELLDSVKEKIKDMQSQHVSGEVHRNTRICELYHETGAGASTLARRVLWDLRETFICLILNEDFKYSSDGAAAIGYLKKLYEKCHLTILLLVDEDLPQYNTESLTVETQSESVPLILFRVIRKLHGISNTTNPKRSLFLKCCLSKNEESKLIEKYRNYFPSKVMHMERERVFQEANTFISDGEHVTAHDQHKRFCQIGGSHSSDGVVLNLVDENTVEIKWSDGSTEHCPVDTVQFTNKKDKMHSFIFYGIFFLVEQYRDRINDYIQKKMGELLRLSDQTDKLEFLAYMSLLFAYNVRYSLPQNCFSEGVLRFNILDNVPEEAHDFVSRNRKGYFRIVHPIVAKVIIDFYVDRVLCKEKKSEFVIKFLQRFIPSDTCANQELQQAISTLLWKRQFTQDDEGQRMFDKRTNFSPLICDLHSDDAIKVLLEGADIFNSSHAFGHLARFYAIDVKNFDKAKEYMECALRLADEHAEGTICTMYGDIYRYELTYRLEEAWENGLAATDKVWSYTDKLHQLACDQYKYCARLLRSLSHPYFGELKVRLNYLKYIRKLKFPGDFNDKAFLEYLISNPAVCNSDGRCIELLDWLSDFAINGDGGKDIGSVDIVSRIKKHRQTLYDIMGGKKRDECIRVTEELLQLPSTNVNHPIARRKYINLHLIHSDISAISKTKRITMLGYLEKNLKEEGYKSDTVRNWFKFACTLPLPHSDVKNALHILKKWETQVQPSSSDVRLIKFYLYVLNFLLALDCSDDNDRFEEFKQTYEKEEAACRRENWSDKTRHWTQMWLSDSGSGIDRLAPGRYDIEQLKMFTGKIGDIDHDKKKGRISFKGFSIFFDFKYVKISTLADARNGSKVQFGISFTYGNVRAINISLKLEGQLNGSNSKPFADVSSPRDQVLVINNPHNYTKPKSQGSPRKNQNSRSLSDSVVSSDTFPGLSKQEASDATSLYATALTKKQSHHYHDATRPPVPKTEQQSVKPNRRALSKIGCHSSKGGDQGPFKS